MMKGLAEEARIFVQMVLVLFSWGKKIYIMTKVMNLVFQLSLTGMVGKELREFLLC